MKKLAEDYSDAYTIVLGDKIFNLSKIQIERDSPNYFTSHFFDSSGRRMVQELDIPRDPYLFELVFRYLNGYQVVPIPHGLVPPYSDPETALADLRADAMFYQLDGLLELCSPKEHTNMNLSVRYAVITGHIHTLPEDFAPCKLEFQGKQSHANRCMRVFS